MVDESTAARREPSATAHWREIMLDPSAAVCTLSEAVADGHSILVVHDASPDECAGLLDAASAKAKAVRAGKVASQQPGKLSLSLALRLEHSSAPMVSPGRIRECWSWNPCGHLWRSPPC